MIIKRHVFHKSEIAEIISDKLIMGSADEALDLMANVYQQGYERMIIHEQNVTPEFFDLKTGIAGEILQKFSNYRVRLAIVGDLSKYSGNSLKKLIKESNKTGYIIFAGSFSEALTLLSSE